MKRLASVLAVLIMLPCAFPALAEYAEVTGQVVNLSPGNVIADLGGMVSDILVSPGDSVRAGDVLAKLRGTKVYALQDGTAHFFGEAGDSAEMVAERYGAVAWIEPAEAYRISASTKTAYDREENRIIHPGETVYLRGADDNRHTGAGMVTSVSGTSFTVEVTEGSFLTGEGVIIFRDSAFAAQSRLGRGDISRQGPVAYTGEGILVSYPVEEGAQVRKGDVLFETLEGSFGGRGGDLHDIQAEQDGTVASLSLKVGESIESGSAVAEFYLADQMRISCMVTETDLQDFHVGDRVRIELIFLEDGTISLEGVVEKISGIGNQAAEESPEAAYTVLVRPDSTDRLLYGMNVLVSVVKTGE